MSVARNRRTGLSFVAFVLAVVILELAISPAFGSGGWGAGNGLVRPFSSSLTNMFGLETTGEVLITASVSRVCIDPSVQGGVGYLSVPMRNLSVIFSSVSGAPAWFALTTNSSGVAKAELQQGIYLVTIKDDRVNRSLMLQVAGGENVLNLTSREKWLSASFFDYQSASVSGQLEPWANLTAAFPKLSNVSIGSRVTLFVGGPPPCPVTGTPASRFNWANATVLSLDRRLNATWATFALAGTPSSIPESLKVVTYVSTYGESNDG